MERNTDDLITGLTGLACAWLQLHTLVTLLSFHYQDFSIQLRNSLNSSWLLRLLIPTAGCSQSVYKLIAQASAQSSGIPALTASQISAIEAIQAALSMISLGVDSVPGTLMLFCLGYSLVRAVKYTVLARWELVERSKVYTKDCTTVRAKESRRIKDESKKAVSEEFRRIRMRRIPNSPLSPTRVGSLSCPRTLKKPQTYQLCLQVQYLPINQEKTKKRKRAGWVLLTQLVWNLHKLNL